MRTRFPRMFMKSKGKVRPGDNFIGLGKMKPKSFKFCSGVDMNTSFNDSLKFNIYTKNYKRKSVCPNMFFVLLLWGGISFPDDVNVVR